MGDKSNRDKKPAMSIKERRAVKRAKSLEEQEFVPKRKRDRA